MRVLAAYGRRPSPGFVLWLALLAAGGGFFIWAGREPPLETVWRLDVELAAGSRGPLAGHELQLLQNALVKHPDLAAFLAEDAVAGLVSQNDQGRIEGPYAYLVRATAKAPRRLEVHCLGNETPRAVAVAARTIDQAKAGRASDQTPFVWQLPQNGPFPQLVELRFFAGRASGVKGRRPPVRVALVEAP